MNRESRSANRTVSQIHQLWYNSNPRKETETENEYIARQQKILSNIDKNLISEKDVKVELGSGRKTKRRKTRTRRYKK